MIPKWAVTDLYDVDVFIRDVVVFVALLVLNVLIFNFMSRTSENKRRISGRVSVESQRAERRKVTMISTMAACFFVGHVTSFTFNILYNSFKSPEFDCFGYLSALPFDLSYSTSIFFYYHFNSTFKRYFLRYFRFCKRQGITPITDLITK